MSRIRLWIEFLLCVVFGVIALGLATSVHERKHPPRENSQAAGITVQKCPDIPDLPSKPVMAVDIPAPQVMCPSGAIYYQKVIWFNANESAFDEQSTTARKWLNELKDVLGHHPTGVIEIVGHSDRSGLLEKNQELSTTRAEEIGHFVKQEIGIAADRVRIVALGSTQPWDEGANCAANARNRRVELRIMEDKQ